MKVFLTWIFGVWSHTTIAFEAQYIICVSNVIDMFFFLEKYKNYSCKWNFLCLRYKFTIRWMSWSLVSEWWGCCHEYETSYWMSLFGYLFICCMLLYSTNLPLVIKFIKCFDLHECVGVFVLFCLSWFSWFYLLLNTEWCIEGNSCSRCYHWEYGRTSLFYPHLKLDFILI